MRGAAGREPPRALAPPGTMAHDRGRPGIDQGHHPSDVERSALMAPTPGEMLLGIEGLSLLRLASGDPAARQARVAEIRALLARAPDASELGSAASGAEYALADGYRLWSETYDRPLRLSPLEEP